MASEFLDTPHFAYHFIHKLFAFQKLFYNFGLNLGVCKFICVYEIPIYTGLNNVNLKINFGFNKKELQIKDYICVSPCLTYLWSYRRRHFICTTKSKTQIMSDETSQLNRFGNTGVLHKVD